MTQPKTDTVRRTEDGDTNVEQQHPGLHTPVRSGPQKVQSDRALEADRNVTVPRSKPADDEGKDDR
ncbi:hypothetical protein [Methylobacterium gnaphalii]|uniref:Uncharacterized protein n=1 Tax=Methylobacterium gnaphalii TaxID=1010610 RepID=A0A512JF59_9HYPH|nr:hypothetical protein [Methylobacterium gnaphalii]GEP08591.1 hypothetical protein MGN01_04360 [Methylobacterium gnaphalii]GJD70574.1 hypothetical protein MMMDOFMJ_3523 [Methylobacterium gnaphalii]GLS50808.1 hypothetical protein GCM10007885_36620 [Methylobacterium gnaphalii]